MRMPAEMPAEMPVGAMRTKGWEARLAAVMEAARETPYVLGEHDCFRLACHAICALTGEDRWPEFAGRYRTKGEALRVIAEYGASFDRAFSWFFGCAPADRKLARRGDIVKFMQEGEAHLGVCLGIRAAVLGDEGLMYVDIADCEHCWRVG